MKKKHLERKWPLFYLSIIILMLLFPCISSAQSIKRQSISSYGSTAMAGQTLLLQTAGQSYATSTFENNAPLLQGFQQPVGVKVKSITAPSFDLLNVDVYPNPASYAIMIQSNEIVDIAYINVTDINGRVIYSEKVIQLSKHTINCESWANGIYFINILDDKNSMKTFKLIVTK